MIHKQYVLTLQVQLSVNYVNRMYLMYKTAACLSHNHQYDHDKGTEGFLHLSFASQASSQA